MSPSNAINNLFYLHDKVAVVTGTAEGSGKATARACPTPYLG